MGWGWGGGGMCPGIQVFPQGHRRCEEASNSPASENTVLEEIGPEKPGNQRVRSHVNTKGSFLAILCMQGLRRGCWGKSHHFAETPVALTPGQSATFTAQASFVNWIPVSSLGKAGRGNRAPQKLCFAQIQNVRSFVASLLCCFCGSLPIVRSLHERTGPARCPQS